MTTLGTPSTMKYTHFNGMNIKIRSIMKKIIAAMAPKNHNNIPAAQCNNPEIMCLPRRFFVIKSLSQSLAKDANKPYVRMIADVTV